MENKNYSLCLSLGHGSSAVLVNNDGEIICGYENERLTGIKSDSKFPIEAIAMITSLYDLNSITDIFVSHWSTFGQVDEMSIKHWRPDMIEALFPNAKIYGNIDHHQCHVSALRAFTERTFDWEIVADGFGNFNEVISIYNKGKLIKRAFGFDKSIGLLYQYATSYLGLKMNQDEYKLLGYESHITTITDSKTVTDIYALANKVSKKIVKSITYTDILVPKFDMVAGLEALPNIRMKIHNQLDNMLKKFDLKKSTNFDKKVIVAYYIQAITESTLLQLVASYGMNEVALTGGIFMNVKLNHAIMQMVKKISIMPICGDQSGGLGAYHHIKKNLKWPGHLFWSKRNFNLIPLNLPNMHVFEKSKERNAWHLITNLLVDDKIVNIITGDGEFGARALGNTTTLAKPTKTNVDYINKINGRNTVMPMAGMVSYTNLIDYYDYDKVFKSLDYMIMTLEYNGQLTESLEGCHHMHPTEEYWTNRVQTNPHNKYMEEVLNIFGILINTSFNIHGQPIVLTANQIIEAHNYQQVLDTDNRVCTIIIK